MGRRLKSKGCCDCGFGLPCSLACQSQAGTASLCGFDTYIPTSPPRKYRRRAVTGTMAVCTTQDPYCQQPPSCPRSVDLTFSGTIPGATGTFTASGHVVDNGYGYYTGSATALWSGSPIGARVSVTVGAVTTHLDSTPRAVGLGNGQAVLEINYVTWTSVGPAICFTSLNAVIIQSQKDTWAIGGQYDKHTCGLTTSDTSTRQIISGQCDGVGSPVSHVFLTPAAEYGSGIAQTVAAAEIDSSGVGCLPLPNVAGISYGGSITEALSDEDTPADAIARAAAPWIGSDCTLGFAYLTDPDPVTFVIAFRNVQVKATIGTIANPLIVGHSYDVRIGFWRKALGSGGPYLFLGFQELGVVADAGIDTTPWIDVPNEAGFQTIAASCSYKDVSFP